MAIPSLDVILNGLTVAAGAALFVERFIELLQSLRERANHLLLQQQANSAQAAELELALVQANHLGNRMTSTDQQALLAAIETIPLDHTADMTAVDMSAAKMTSGDAEHPSFERHRSIPFIPLPESSLEQIRLNAFLTLGPVAVGIVVAAIFELHLLAMFRGEMVYPIREVIESGDVGQFFYQQFDVLLSGILIGGGSQPVHVLIQFLTSRKLTDEERQRRVAVGYSEESQSAVVDDKPVSVTVDPYQWQPLVYLGGVRPESLEHVHQRDADADQIVVHHTAMHSKLSFDAIVDEFLQNKGWLTGYHAVIMPDGAIKPFCRWDRTGNHAAGHNHHTLGIAFHGNFHQGSDAFSNNDGRYGNLHPTPEQLDAGARLIALWTFLYPDMRDDFLLPHRQLATARTVCPGSRFPWQTLVDGVSAYRSRWSTQTTTLEAIEQFSRRPYLYTNQLYTNQLDTNQLDTQPLYAKRLSAEKLSAEKQSTAVEAHRVSDQMPGKEAN